MTEELQTISGTKEEQYILLVKQVKGLISYETDFIANLANIAAAIHHTFPVLWTGFYLVKGKELVLGPFQGPIACTRITLGKGVCGTVWQERKPLIVPNVDKFPGHIACSSLSKSEIVIPLLDNNNEVVLVLDIDSEKTNYFDTIDERYLSEIVSALISPNH